MGNERCCLAHSSSCFGFGTLRRYSLRSRRTLRLRRSGWNQLPQRSSGTRCPDVAPKVREEGSLQTPVTWRRPPRRSSSSR